MNCPFDQLTSRINTAVQSLNTDIETLKLHLEEISQSLEDADIDITSEDILFDKLDAGRRTQEDIWVAEQSINDLNGLKSIVAEAKTFDDLSSQQLQQILELPYIDLTGAAA
jgi:hypothetical protein